MAWFHYGFAAAAMKPFIDFFMVILKISV